jgi:hypothetical protein
MNNVEEIKKVCKELEEAMIEDLETKEAENRTALARSASRKRLQIAKGRVFDIHFDVAPAKKLGGDINIEKAEVELNPILSKKDWPKAEETESYLKG